MRISRERVDRIVDQIIATGCYAALAGAGLYAYNAVAGPPTWWPQVNWSPWLAGLGFAFGALGLIGSALRSRQQKRRAAAEEASRRDDLGHVNIGRGFDDGWVADELRWLGFSEEAIAAGVTNCVLNLRVLGIETQEQARAFFDDVRARRLHEHLYQQAFGRGMDPDGYGHWAATWHLAPEQEKGKLWSQHGAALQRARRSGAS